LKSYVECRDLLNIGVHYEATDCGNDALDDSGGNRAKHGGAAEEQGEHIQHRDEKRSNVETSKASPPSPPPTAVHFHPSASSQASPPLAAPPMAAQTSPPSQDKEVTRIAVEGLNRRY
jgi:hypothetical protein